MNSIWDKYMNGMKAIAVMILLLANHTMSAQILSNTENRTDSLEVKLHTNSIKKELKDSLVANLSQIRGLTEQHQDKLLKQQNPDLQKSLQQWKPNPITATWLALVIPGGGQIYNRKYWKLPIIYGGFAGCAYALTWNSNMYHDYMNAYRDAINNKWESKNITELLPPGYLKRVSQSQLKDILKRRKDRFRRYRDLSIFAFIGTYLISVVDAYVDADLSDFDIGPDLSLNVHPTIINSNKGTRDTAYGVGCSLTF